MFALRTLLALVVVAGALANPLESRQASNTNSQISSVIDALDVQIHHSIPTILTLQANGSATDGTVGAQVNQLTTAFTNAANQLKAIPISSGSTTVAPTNDDIGIVFSDGMQQLATGLSGLTTARVPTFTAMIAQLDPAVASAITALNTTLPNTTHLVHIMMLDAQQFLVKEGAWPETIAALGF